MPVFTRPDAEINYEVHGSGFPLLLFAPGSLRSQLEYWRYSPSNPDAPAPWMNPMVDLAGRFTVIGMDHLSSTLTWCPVGKDNAFISRMKVENQGPKAGRSRRS